MDIEILTGIAGVLGLVFSIFVFILTRWERRSRAVIELFRGDPDRIDAEFSVGETEPGMAIGIRVVNVGAIPIVVDRSSLLISGNKRSITVHDTD